MKSTYNFLLLNKKLLKVLLLGLLIFTLTKIVFAIRFGNLKTFVDYSSDIPQMIFNSLRFDLQSLAYIFALIFAVNLVAFISISKQTTKLLNKISIIYLPIILTLAIILLIADQQFYSFFKLHFNSVAFDFFDEEPRLLIKSMWLEHPVIRIFLITILMFFVIRFFVKKIYTKTILKINSINIIFRLSIIILIFGLYFLLMRGSVGTFPLQKEDINVSENEFINACVTNGLYSLKEANAEINREFKIDLPENILRSYGYNSIAEAFADYKGLPLDSIRDKNFEDLAFSTSHLNKSGKKYNVVYLIMESMSNHFLNFHNEKYNLLGRLEKHFNEDIVFRNFQSASNGTVATLESILINTPYHSIFDTKYRFRSYDLAITKPFKDAGYETSFITGIELGWRHLNEALQRQYIDQVSGKKSILRNYPEAESNDTWGVYDHFVLDFIYDQLIQKDTAMFIVSLSSTNHTPYELPEDYEPYKIDPSIAENPEFIIKEERCLEILTAFQYSNDALGGFLDKIKSSHLAENTIVIITGDHNNRSALSYNTSEMMKYKFSVPLYLYIPDDIKQNLFIDTERWSSHYDIITSIYPYILNDIKYPNLGQNLFDKDLPSNEFYSINDAQLLYDKDNEAEIVKKINARQAITRYYYSTMINGAK